MKDPALVRGGAEFYWIAGLGFANCVMNWFGNLPAYLKLWAQLHIDWWAETEILKNGADPNTMKLTALAACGGLSLVFVICGFLSRRNLKLAFLAGFLLYTADSVATVVNVAIYLKRDGTLIIPWWFTLFVHGYFMVMLIGALKNSGKAPSSALADSMLNANQ
ncbi:MAG: hypothetical protein ACYTGX_19120 [Planctomycetota bacterium]|jgi:hypothetical protein